MVNHGTIFMLYYLESHKKMKKIDQIKKILPVKLKFYLRKLINLLLLDETITASKKKWNRLATDNAKYYVLTDLGEHISEEEFQQAGQKDFRELIAKDPIINSGLGNLKSKTALEIGCGIGRITEFIAQNFAKVFAIDISDEMIGEGQKRLKNYSNINFIIGNGLTFPIPDNSIDFVFSYIVFQHMPNKQVIKSNFQEIRRVLKDTGLVKIQVRGLPTSKRNWYYGPSFSKDEITHLLTSCGLKLIKTKGENERYFWLWIKKI